MLDERIPGNELHVPPGDFLILLLYDCMTSLATLPGGEMGHKMASMHPSN